jgi:hypothetical protein
LQRGVSRAILSFILKAADMTDTPSNSLASNEIQRFGDEDAERGAGLNLPCLRVMQSAGAIRAEKEPKFHGGFRRTWTEQEILKAAIGSAMGEQFAWNIRVVAAAMAAHKGVWDQVASLSLKIAQNHTDGLAPEATLMLADQLDWHAELIDRTFLFLMQPPEWMAVSGIGTANVLMGMAGKDGFHTMTSAILTTKGRAEAVKLYGEDRVIQAERTARIALGIQSNFLGKATFNISMAVRAARRRLHGLEARYAFHPLNGEPSS